MKRWDLDSDYERRARIRFNSKYTVNDAGCWNWSSSLCSTGQRYGTFHYRGSCRRAHKVAYLMFKGPVPDGLEIDHTCGNTSCVNPAHLEAVTHLENVRRSPTTRLTMNDARAIRAELAPIVERLKEAYGVSTWTLIDIADGRKWREGVA